MILIDLDLSKLICHCSYKHASRSIGRSGSIKGHESAPGPYENHPDPTGEKARREEALRRAEEAMAGGYPRVEVEESIESLGKPSSSSD